MMAQQNDPQTDVRQLEEEIDASPLLPILEAEGISASEFSEAVVRSIEAYGKKSIVQVAAEASEKAIDWAPQFLDMCRRGAVNGRGQASSLFRSAVLISEIAGQDWNKATDVSTRFAAEVLGISPVKSLDPNDLCRYLFALAEGIWQASDTIQQWLDDFQQGRPGIISAFALFPALAQLKPHEFVTTLKVGHRELDLTDPSDYIASLFLSLWLGRPDLITKAVHFRLANRMASSGITHQYAEVGGDQDAIETTAQGQLERSLAAITEVPFPEGVKAADSVLGRIGELLREQQEFEMAALGELQRLESLSQPASLDEPLDTEDEEPITLGDLSLGEEDLEQAIAEYYDVVSTLPPEMQPIFRRVWERGETPKEAAINLGHEWTPARERQVRRMLSKIREDMLTK